MPQKPQKKISAAFRVQGLIKKYEEGRTKTQVPYVKVEFSGTTPQNKTVSGTIMAFGAQAISLLDVSDNKKTGRFYIRRNGFHFRPAGPWFSDEKIAAQSVSF